MHIHSAYTRFIRVLTAAACCCAFMSPAAQAEAQLQVGYMPIIADSQAFVIADGLTRENPLKDVKLISFQNGPEIVQALLSGQLDAAYVGAGPGMVARAGGAAVKFVAANENGTARVLALGNFAPYFKDATPAEAVARFTKEKGRKPVFTTFPIGSGPAAALRYWLRDVSGIGADGVKIIYQGENQLVQSLLSGAVDANVSPDPANEIAQERRPDAKVVAVIKDQPGAGLLVRERLIQEHPDVVRALVEAQLEATDLLRNEPKKAAVAVQKYMGGGRLSMAVVEQSMKNQEYGADPVAFQKLTEKLYEFQHSMGVFKKPLVVSDLFDASFYDAARKEASK